MRCGTSLLFVLELIVALPYRPFIFIGGVPGLGPEEPSAVFAYKPCSEYAVPAVPSAEAFSPCHFKLNQFPVLGRNDGIMGMLYVVLWNFAVVVFHFVLKEIHRELLLCCDRATDTILFFLGKGIQILRRGIQILAGVFKSQKVP